MKSLMGCLMMLAAAACAEIAVKTVDAEGAKGAVGELMAVTAVSPETGTVTLKREIAGPAVYTNAVGRTVTVSNWLEQAVASVVTNQHRAVTNYVPWTPTSPATNIVKAAWTEILTNWTDVARSSVTTNTYAYRAFKGFQVVTNTVGRLSVANGFAQTNLVDTWLTGERLWIEGTTNATVRLVIRK